MFCRIILILLLININELTEGARILGIFPYPSYSHQIVYNALSLKLRERGHELTIFTTGPLNKNLTNYTEVSLKSLYNVHTKMFNFTEISAMGSIKFLNVLMEFGGVITDYIYSHLEMKKIIIYKDKMKFDVILVSAMLWDALYYLSDLLNTPMIGISTLPTQLNHDYLMGFPVLTSGFPDPLSDFTDDMTFIERISNIYRIAYQLGMYHWKHLPIQSRVLKKHFGDTAPSAEKFCNRLSIILTTSHPFFDYPKPLMPGILPVGGLRFSDQNKTLPKDLKQILDTAENGFVYFSLGTNVKSNILGKTILNTLIQAFSELPYLILWKLEANEGIKMPNNVYIREWMPQTGILAHPNLKLFMYQGGLQSTEEAIDSGIPVLGFPFYSDQLRNIKILTRKGVARKLSLFEIDKHIIKEAINELITNSSYRENMVKLRELLHDRPMDPMNESIWWIEHVIRHKEGAHLRARSRDLPLYKVELLDVILFLFFLLAVLLALSWTLLRLAIALIKAYIFPFIFKSEISSKTLKKCKAS